MKCQAPPLRKWMVFMRELGDGARDEANSVGGRAGAYMQRGHLHAADPVSVTEAI